MKKKTKSPLKKKPLRYSGQSLDDEIFDLISGKFVSYLLLIACFFIATLYQWINFIFQKPINPLLMTIIFFIVFIFSIFKIIKIKKQLKILKLGRDGERAVGQYLEELRIKGYRIFHDIIGDNFNLDHVIISPKGIFVIETKTYSKPVEGRANIELIDNNLFLNGKNIGDKPIIQVKAASNWLKNILKESTGKDFNVFPILVFPGWFVKFNSSINRDLWVLNPKALPEWLNNLEDKIIKEDMMLASFHISRFIRAQIA